jgi:hypothetical protein
MVRPMRWDVTQSLILMNISFYSHLAFPSMSQQVMSDDVFLRQLDKSTTDVEVRVRRGAGARVPYSTSQECRAQLSLHVRPHPARSPHLSHSLSERTVESYTVHITQRWDGMRAFPPGSRFRTHATWHLGRSRACWEFFMGGGD